MKKFDIYDSVNKQIFEQLEKGNIPWRMPWHTEDGPVNLVSKKEYGGFNWFILSITQREKNYSSNVWASFKQIQDRGGQVKKGEHSTMVVYWKILEFETDRVNKKGEKIIDKVPLLRYYNVFNLDQTEGIKITKKELRQIKKNLTAESIIKEYSKQINFQYGGNQAYYSPVTDCINIPKREQFLSDDLFYATNFHEMTHSTGHQNRLGRLSDETYNHTFGSEDYSKEELIAEMGSSYLCAKTNTLPAVIENKAAYIQSWLRSLKNDKTLLISSAGKAQKAVNYILGEDK